MARQWSLIALRRRRRASSYDLLAGDCRGASYNRHGRIGDDGGQVEELPDAKVGELLEFLDFCGFGKGQSILNIDTKIAADGAFDLRVAKQDLYGAQIARLLIYNRRLGTTQ